MIPKRSRIAVIGAGAWATTVAHLLAMKGHAVTVWGKDREVLQSIRSGKENKKYLEGLKISPKIQVNQSLVAAVRGANMVVFGIPTQFMRSVVRKAARSIEPGTMLVNLAKGIEHKTFSRGSEILQQETRARCPVAVLSGPNIAREIVQGRPSKSVVSSSDVRYLPWLQEVFTAPFFKIYTNPDMVGVELSGALKNVVAILAGVSDGLGYGDNTKSALITRGLAEMVQFGIHFGANPNTFFGLAGIGDLVVTCSSPYSRNRTFGELIAKGNSIRKSLRLLKGRIPEGLETSSAVHRLSQEINLEMPLSRQVYRILHRKDRSVHSLFHEIWDWKVGFEFA